MNVTASMPSSGGQKSVFNHDNLEVKKTGLVAIFTSLNMSYFASYCTDLCIYYKRGNSI